MQLQHAHLRSELEATKTARECLDSERSSCSWLCRRLALSHPWTVNVAYMTLHGYQLSYRNLAGDDFYCPVHQSMLYTVRVCCLTGPKYST